MNPEAWRYVAVPIVVLIISGAVIAYAFTLPMRHRHRAATLTLIRARSLITDNRHWCRGAMAVDAKGAAAHAHETRAVAWCARGSLLKVDGPYLQEATKRLAHAINRVGTTSRPDFVIEMFNDASMTTHTDVIEMFTKAINKPWWQP